MTTTSTKAPTTTQRAILEAATQRDDARVEGNGNTLFAMYKRGWVTGPELDWSTKRQYAYLTDAGRAVVA